MRLLIANDMDDAIVHKVDVRSWAQRVMWLVQDGDAVILMDEPDEDFVRYVADVKGIDRSTLRFLVLPGAGRFNRRMFDHELLLDAGFISTVRELGHVDDVVALWNSPFVVQFLCELGLSHLWESHRVYAQDAVESFNNKGQFRIFASAAGVPIPDGFTCRTVDEALFHSRRLFARYPALMVKRAHGGGGSGNLLLTSQPSVQGTRSGNSRRAVVHSQEDLADFWVDQWDWASSNGRYPVVVERYIDQADTLYVEYFLDETGIGAGASGELHFVDGSLAREVVPTRAVDPSSELLAAAGRLATVYHRLGCRGYLSADAIAKQNGYFAFTEVNHRFTGSTHLYTVLRKLPKVKEGDLSVTQLTSPSAWGVRTVAALREALETANVTYWSDATTAVVPITPPIGEKGVLILAVIHPPGHDVQEVLNKVAESLMASNSRSQ
ncbi:hypothetical protein [Leifsonia virtsii]|uniref:ATP-grasp domain-containing protein n=1 Tax=Leifsonia virtsii TaxID=3035915 RepID=A0ABT8IVP7_9MICO|nr:hypothetical protein [Leifsonia virtsii]MDN4596865.1 hypothetical protein [Leifsonia virtsii]